MTDDNIVYLAWQDPESRRWHTVGQLAAKPHGYLFAYTKGAKSSPRFIAFDGMREFDGAYFSADLFPLFKNRLLSARRPEYKKFMAWLGFDSEQHGAFDPLEVLSRSGGLRVTDSLQIYRAITPMRSGDVEHYFFAHGLSHLGAATAVRVAQLKVGERLALTLDVQNQHDENAVLIRADEPAQIVGYCPRFLSRPLRQLLLRAPSQFTLTVEKVSTEAPTHYRLLCRLTGSLGAEYGPALEPDSECSPLI
ncbi:MAG: HIRAN domain-containing protein [Shewanella sp.]|uniref:HIRAN domain-containing protein n=1 Tax=Shewanella sp. TaxID=50422 RepID=UPI003F407AC2